MDQQKMKAIAEELLQVEREFKKDRVTIATQGTKHAAMFMGEFRTELVASYAPDDRSVLNKAREIAKHNMILILLKMDPLGIDLYKVEGVGGKGCFIATAACGSPLAPEVLELCKYRDDVLLHLSSSFLKDMGRLIILPLILLLVWRSV